MRKLPVLAIIAVLVPTAVAKVWTTVYRCDETTPLAAVDLNHPTVYQDIMVGTRLVIVVSGDTGGYWVGQLRLSWEDAPYANLSGRGPTTVSGVSRPYYRDSCLPAAGKGATTQDYNNPRGVGFEFDTSAYSPVVPGDWFLFDYQAERVGSCDVGLYDLDVGYDVPIETLSFTQVPSRDFNGDTIINFEDLALLAGHWRLAVDADPNNPAGAFDLDADSHIGMSDLAAFSDYWLERTACGGPVNDPNVASSNP